MGKVELVGEEQARGQKCRGHENGSDDAVNAHAGGFDDRDLVRPLHDAEGDENGEQHYQRGDVVKQIGSYVEQIFRDHERGCLVAKDVAEQLEEREDQRQNQEGGEDQSQINEEVAQDVVVEQRGEAGAEHATAVGDALEDILGAAGGWAAERRHVPRASASVSRRGTASRCAAGRPPGRRCRPRGGPP